MAEEYGKIRKSLLTGIGNAIREKKNTTDLLTPEQMATEIEGLSIVPEGARLIYYSIVESIATPQVPAVSTTAVGTLTE